MKFTLIFFVITFSVFTAAATTAFASEQSEQSRSRLISALIVVESKGNDDALGDVRLRCPAYGCLQIRQPCVDDVNRAFGTKYRAKDCLGNRELSIFICEKYLSIYATKKRLGREPTPQDCARIWNGGPFGYEHFSTKAYWSKVRKVLEN